jgi:hypothetical protein
MYVPTGVRELPPHCESSAAARDAVSPRSARWSSRGRLADTTAISESAKKPLPSSNSRITRISNVTSVIAEAPVGLKTNGDQAEVQRTAEIPPLSWVHASEDSRQYEIGGSFLCPAMLHQGRGRFSVRRFSRRAPTSSWLRICRARFAPHLSNFPREPIVVIDQLFDRFAGCGPIPGAMRVSLACASARGSLPDGECTEASRRINAFRSLWRSALVTQLRTVNNQ